MKPLISLIIPVYNSDDFLPRSIEAFQNLLYSKMELILVDDGSTDSSLSICKQFAKKDSRIKVFHKNNGGAASARNYGIEHSSGKYIAFCDSDDYYEPTAFDIMENLAEENNADIVCCDARVKNIRNTRCFHKGPELAVCDNVEGMTLLLRNQGTSSNVWGRLYKRTLFDSIRFPEGRVYEDVAVSYLLFAAAQCTVFTNKPLYNWCRRPGSIQTRQDEQARQDELKAALDRYDYVAKHYCDPLPEIAYSELMFDLVHVYECYVKCHYDLFHIKDGLHVAEISHLVKRMSWLRYLPLRKRVEAILLLHARSMFNLIVICVSKLKEVRP